MSSVGRCNRGAEGEGGWRWAVLAASPSSAINRHLKPSGASPLDSPVEIDGPAL